MHMYIYKETPNLCIKLYEVCLVTNVEVTREVRAERESIFVPNDTVSGPCETWHDWRARNSSKLYLIFWLYVFLIVLLALLQTSLVFTLKNRRWNSPRTPFPRTLLLYSSTSRHRRTIRGEMLLPFYRVTELTVQLFTSKLSKIRSKIRRSSLHQNCQRFHQKFGEEFTCHDHNLCTLVS